MESELKTNAVHLSPKEQYQIRKSIIRLWKEVQIASLIAQGKEAEARGCDSALFLEQSRSQPRRGGVPAPRGPEFHAAMSFAVL